MKRTNRFSRGAIAVATALALSTTAVVPTATAAVQTPISDATTTGLSVGSASLGSTAGSVALSFGVPLLILALVYNMAVKAGAVQGAPVAIPGLPG